MSGEFQFKNSGKSVSKEIEDINFANTINISNLPFGIKTPVDKGILNKESLFKMNFNIEDQIEDNLKNLLLTRRGERLCFSDIGTDLKKIYSLKNKEDIEEIAMKEIQITVNKYMPFINLINFTSVEEKSNSDSEVIFKLTLDYSISGLSDQKRSITLNLTTSR